VTRTAVTADPPDVREMHGFLLELGRMLSLAGTAVSETQERLTAIAAAADADDARVIVLPTALMIAFGRAGWATIESIPQLAGGLRLDQISVLYEGLVGLPSEKVLHDQRGICSAGARVLAAGPGALGLIGITELVGNRATASIGTLVKPVGSIISIALGVLGGVSIYCGLAATPRRLHAGRAR